MELDNILIIGNKLKIFYEKGNPNNKLIHILAVVDEDMIVYKYYGKHKQKWFYCVENYYYFFILFEQGHLSKVYGG